MKPTMWIVTYGLWSYEHDFSGVKLQWLIRESPPIEATSKYQAMQRWQFRTRELPITARKHNGQSHRKPNQ